jgi:hypothetical protein
MLNVHKSALAFVTPPGRLAEAVVQTSPYLHGAMRLARGWIVEIVRLKSNDQARSSLGVDVVQSEQGGRLPRARLRY